MSGTLGEELEWDVIGQLLGIPAIEAEEITSQSYELLRQQAAQADTPPQWTLLRNSGRCVVCDREIVIMENGWGWCSDDCYQWLPPAAVEAEARWGVAFHTLLDRWKKLNLRTLERMLGLDRQTLRWLIWQHLGFMEENPSHWRKQEEELVTNPKIPSPKQLLERITTAQGWRGDE
jgi:hypothetical protein